MRKITFFTIISCFIVLLISCKTGATDKGTVILSNPNDFPLKDYVVEIETSIIPGPGEYLVARQDDSLLPTQYISPQSPGANGKLIINIDLPASAKIKISILPVKETDLPAWDKRTLAELWHKTGGEFVDQVYTGGGEFKKFNYLRVPDECTDHSFYIKYEGPGWESDKIGYRFYLDWRNAVDIYGKKVHNMILPGVGQDGYDSYHEMNDWGMDVLKVGSSLGVGSIGFWDGEKANRVAVTDSVICAIAQDGVLYSEVKTGYFGWKIDSSSVNLHSLISIKAGSRASHQILTIDGELDNLCTGIVKIEGGELITSNAKEGWNYLATWGKQSLNNDNLGMAVLYSSANLPEITEDKYSHVVVLKPVNNSVDYYFLGAWELEPEGINSPEEFKKYLDRFITVLDNPVKVK